jgi:hypothetical protein
LIARAALSMFSSTLFDGGWKAGKTRGLFNNT